MQYLTLIPCRTSLRSCYLVWYLAGYTFDFLVRYAVSYQAAAAWHCKKDRERFSAHFIIHSSELLLTALCEVSMVTV